mmetsp:Transcript_10227/g.12943  ORF Transcript_10227/g.12943 Transcript_10227/m.12943 type:complete len:149 (-) Transcript_10227:441-887(-)
MLTHIAEKLGIWDILAPSPTPTPTQNAQMRQDEKLAHTLQQEEDIRYKKLKTQYDSEQRAEKINQFVKRQRVSYHAKAEDKWIDAVVVGVHFDDGPDRPYYTIKYKKLEQSNENCNEFKKYIDMEKQTNAERLTRLPWDEEKSWALIK